MALKTATFTVFLVKAPIGTVNALSKQTADETRALALAWKLGVEAASVYRMPEEGVIVGRVDPDGSVIDVTADAERAWRDV